MLTVSDTSYVHHSACTINFTMENITGTLQINSNMKSNDTLNYGYLQNKAEALLAISIRMLVTLLQ